jgi:hypothetical protein
MKEQGQLRILFGLQDKADNRRKELLIDDHRHYRKENSQQGGKGKRFRKRLADGLFIGHTRQGCGEDND